jgi:hypothetical protein
LGGDKRPRPDSVVEKDSAVDVKGRHIEKKPRVLGGRVQGHGKKQK